MQVLRSVGVLSFAKMAGAVYGALGLVFAPFVLLAGMIGSIAGPRQNPLGPVFSIFFAIIMPVLYAGIGFVMGAVGAFAYNLVAKWVGGVEVELFSPAPPVLVGTAGPNPGANI
jgi:hypothetical protein